MGEIFKSSSPSPGGRRRPQAADEGRHQSRTLYRPTPVPGSARSTLSQERVFYPHKNIPKAEAFGIFSINVLYFV